MRKTRRILEVALGGNHSGGGTLMVHIGNEGCVTHVKDFVPTSQTGGCD